MNDLVGGLLASFLFYENWGRSAPLLCLSVTSLLLSCFAFFLPLHVSHSTHTHTQHTGLKTTQDYGLTSTIIFSSTPSTLARPPPSPRSIMSYTTHPPPTEPPAELPDLDHLTMADFGHIYEPSDDTFLLMDALEADTLALQALRPRIVVEIGYVVSRGRGRGQDEL